MSKKGIIYAEVYEILSCMDKATVMKIPVEILNVFKNKRNKDYISRIDKNDIFNKDNVEKQTLDIIAWLDLDYWATEEEKISLIEKYKENDINLELQKQKEYNQKYNDSFNNSNPELTENNISESLEIAKIKVTIFTKIKLFFQNIFNKNKNTY